MISIFKKRTGTAKRLANARDAGDPERHPVPGFPRQARAIARQIPLEVERRAVGNLEEAAQALANIGDAKSMLTVAEGSLGTAMDILHTMKGKTVQAANDTMGVDERTAIGNELAALASELDDIVNNTVFALSGNAIDINVTTNIMG